MNADASLEPCLTHLSNLTQARVEDDRSIVDLPIEIYQPPTKAEIAINTSLEPAERSALRILAYLEEHGYIAPRWEEADPSDEEIATVKARLQALGYLD